MDVIKQLVEGGGQLLAKIFTGKEEENNHVLVIEALTPADLHLIINALVSEGKINEAENLLFKMMEKEPTEELYRTGVAFYQRLSKFSDKKLTDADYSRAEIAEGRADFDALKARSIIFNKTEP